MPKMRKIRRACLLASYLLSLSFLFQNIQAQQGAQAKAEAIPRRAYQYRDGLRKEVIRIWGLERSLSVFAAQVHQESSWRPLARSSHAGGLAQFTPDTADWISTLDRELAQSKDVFNPRWALRALVLYDRILYSKFPTARTEDDRLAFMLASYNGGLGWILKERKKALAGGCEKELWFSCVEHYCIRSEISCRENRNYPRRILYRWRPIYEEF